MGKFIHKVELLDRLGFIENELKNVRQGKNTAKTKVLVEELKRRVAISPDNIHIPFDISCPTIVCASCDHFPCGSPLPKEVADLQNQLNDVLSYLGATEDDECSEVMSSESTIDTISDTGSEEDKSLVVHDNEVIFIGKNRETNTEDSVDLITSTEKCMSSSNREDTASNSGRKGILLNRMDNGNVIRDGCPLSDAKRKASSRGARTVRFCNQSSVHIIHAEPAPLSLEERLAKARGLINEARNSRQTLVRAAI